MIRSIPGLPDGVVGVELIGDVTSEDYRDALEPLIDAAAGRGAKLRLLAIVGPEFTGYSPGALLEDAAVGLRNWSAWERVALVTDREAIAEAVSLLGWLMPGDLRTFPIDEVAAATDWLVG